VNDFPSQGILPRAFSAGQLKYEESRRRDPARGLPIRRVTTEGVMISEQYLVMYVSANLIALAILALAFWRPRIARWIWVAIFVWAASVNTMTAARTPWEYLAYAALTPSELYREFIEGWFSTHIQPFVLSIAVGQLIIAVLLARAGDARRLGVVGASVFLLAIAPLGIGSGFPFSLIAIASLVVMERRRRPALAPQSPAAAFIPTPSVWDRHEIVIDAPADLVFFDATRLDLRSLPLVRAIFQVRAWLMGDTLEPPAKPLGIVADTMVLGWSLLAHSPCRTIVMGAAARPWTRNVTFRTIPREEFPAFAEPDYVKIVWTLEADPIGPERTRFRTETRVEPTDEKARQKFFWYWMAFGLGIRFIRWSMLRDLRRRALRHHHEWAARTIREKHA
jgi:hypothetical protein